MRLPQLAFSYPDIVPIYARIQREGIEIVKRIHWNSPSRSA